MAQSGTSCVRHRKPWHQLSDEEQLLYSKGFQTLRREGVLAKFIMSHAGSPFLTTNMHHTSANFYWHSYWLWELETEIRNLGGEFMCFALPFWDPTVDAEYWSTSDDPQIEDIPIYNSNLGGEGDVDHDYCVVDEPWTVNEYTTDTLCAEDEESGHCCLKRHHEEGSGTLYPRSDFAELVYASNYSVFSDFTNRINRMHGGIQLFCDSPPFQIRSINILSGNTSINVFLSTFIAGVEGTHFHPPHTDSNATSPSSIGEPTADPLFPVCGCESVHT